MLALVRGRQNEYKHPSAEAIKENTTDVFFVKLVNEASTGWRQLALANAEYLGAANRAYSLCCRAPVLKCNRLRVLDFPFGSTLHTVSLHFDLLLSIYFSSRLADISQCVNMCQTALCQTAVLNRERDKLKSLVGVSEQFSSFSLRRSSLSRPCSNS